MMSSERIVERCHRLKSAFLNQFKEKKRGKKGKLALVKYNMFLRNCEHYSNTIVNVRCEFSISSQIEKFLNESMGFNLSV